MKNTKYFSVVLLILTVLFWACQEEEPELQAIVAPTNLVVTVDLVGADSDNPFGDGSGFVNVTVTADDAVSYQVAFNGNVRVAPSGKYRFTSDFTTVGINSYRVTAIALGSGGISNSEFIDVEVFYDYQPPEELLEKLYGEGSKTWRIKSEQGGHFGLGPIGGVIPVEWYGASPDEKVGTGMYDDRYVFNEDGTLNHITDINDAGTTGTVFGRETLIEELNGAVADLETQGADVLNYPYDDVTVNWSITAPGGVETINLTGKGFFGYYIGGNHSYEIFDRQTPNELLIRSTDGNGEFDWWFILTSEEKGDTNSNILASEFTNLVWSDEFDVDGAPNTANWSYDLGAGGWGNGEAQTYTNNSENVIVEGGILKITAKDNGAGGYTSARLKSENLQEFVYGRVEVRAKLPVAQGTWPAIWMLGANFDTVGWPLCGEMDIMEQTGQDKSRTSAAVHFPNNSGGSAPTDNTQNDTATTAFHNYSVEWTSDEIKIAVDDEVFFSFANTESTPFNSDFFFIMNIAMGGTLGGAIDDAFAEDSMEVDYIRVYQ